MARGAGKRKENRDLVKRRKSNRDRRLNNLNYRLRGNLSARIVTALRGAGKSKRTMELLGCSILAFKFYLEAKFLPGMTWENYGTHWEVDHIKPCARFDLTNPAQQKECFGFYNTQPLWKSQNRRKSDKYAE